MLYRRPVNKLMRRASLPLVPSRCLGISPFRSWFNESTASIYALKSLILIHSPLWISTIRDLATNRRLFLLDRRPWLMIRYAEKEGCRPGRGGWVAGQGGEGERWSRKSDRMSTTNLSAILREFFPRRQRATSGENRALRLHSLINMQIWRRGARRRGKGEPRDDSRCRRERKGDRMREEGREREIKGGVLGPLFVVGDGQAGAGEKG